MMDDYHELIADRVKDLAEGFGRKIDYVEVGVLTGNSARAVLGTGKCRHATLIDSFLPTPMYAEWKSSPELVEKNLEEFKGLFDIRVGDSAVVLPTLLREYDIGFVDGDHSEAGCLSDMEKMFPLIRKRGIMFVDDLQNPEQLEMVAINFATAHQLRFVHHKVHHGLGELWRTG